MSVHGALLDEIQLASRPRWASSARFGTARATPVQEVLAFTNGAYRAADQRTAAGPGQILRLPAQSDVAELTIGLATSRSCVDPPEDLDGSCDPDSPRQ